MNTNSPLLRRIRPACAFAFTILMLPAACPAEKWIALELYVTGDESDKDVQAWAEAALADRDGVNLAVYDLSTEDGGRKRYEAICSYYKLDPDDSAPLLYGCQTTIRRPDTEKKLRDDLDKMLRMTVFVRSGCPHCARAKQYLETLKRKYPGFEIVYRDIISDRRASSDMQEVVRRYHQSAVSVPVFHFCNQVIVGFDRDSTTGRRLESALDRWTYEHRDTSQVEPSSADEPTAQLSSTAGLRARHVDGATTSDSNLMLCGPVSRALIHCRLPVLLVTVSVTALTDPADTDADSQGRGPPAADESESDADAPPLPLPGPPPLPLPGDEPPPPAEVGGNEAVEATQEAAPPEDLFHIPFYGDASASRLANSFGLPVFTIIIGLIDGFNPCAMWVLLFLLSILVNLKNRWKILAVAGTFVFVSGLAYFAFMAAWLTVWSWIRYLRPAELVLGLLAVVIGTIHVKDFFAFKKGVSLSIPESAKPGIYARVRRIVMAENLWGAIIGASVLAVLVNLIELLCTAGLPALYTNVLTKQQLAAWHEYAYLFLYNVAYMFDDSLMVAAVVITLGRHKLQQTQGRWLKLVSGLVVLSLGVVLLFKPDLLNWSPGIPE